MNIDQLEDIDMQTLVTSYWGTDNMPEEQICIKKERERERERNLDVIKEEERE